MPYHVLHILETAQPSCTSFARIVSGLASGLDPQRYCVHAWFLHDDGPLFSELQAAGALVRLIGWRGARRDPLGAWRFWKALRSQEWAIIHLHSGGRSVRWLARGASRASIIQHLHGRVIESKGPRLLPRKVWNADAIIAASNAVAEIAVGKQPHVVYPGVRLSVNGGIAPNAPQTARKIIGTACRLVPIKGIVYLIRAVALLCQDMSDLRLEIAGSGPERTQLENEVRLLGLTDRITFLGWQMDVDTLLARWDIFVMSSLEEGLPIAALEAMASGLPVVATSVGGVPELVEDGRTGWLVPPQDPAALAERLRALLLHPEQRLAMGAAGRARARDCFSIDRMVASISKIYDNVLSPAGKG